MAALSLGPFPQPDLPGPLEYLPHTAAYAATTYVLLAWIRRNRESGGRRGLTVAIVASMILLGVVLELGQHLVDRKVRLTDVLANVVGVAAAVVAWMFTRARAPGP